MGFNYINISVKQEIISLVELNLKTTAGGDKEPQSVSELNM